VISGLWHGADWTFVAWGALNGFYMLFGAWTQNARRRLAETVGLDRLPALHRSLQVAITFSLVAFAWIFFRAESIGDAGYIATHLFSMPPGALSWEAALMGQSRTEWLLAVASVAFMELVHVLQGHGSVRHMLLGRPAWVRAALYAGLPAAILLFGNYASHEFIYFQF
jgi:D-alanyl-lipoteichoic acid acyltransferase DltB (MBOAT superfamily)